VTVFISYSHEDQAFVDRLSIALLNNNIKVWRDNYKIMPGDALSSRINAAINSASFFCVVLSQRSVTARWVEREVEASLLRVARGAPLVVVPIVIDECEIPHALKDHMYLDFRPGFDDAIPRLLKLLKLHYDSDVSSGAADGPGYFTYYGVEEGWVSGRHDLLLEIVSVDREERFCVLTKVRFRGNDAATVEGFQELGIVNPRTYVLAACARAFAQEPARVEVRPRLPARVRFFIESPEDSLRFDVTVEVTLLGDHKGEIVHFNYGALFEQIHDIAPASTDSSAPEEPK
jgi:hypothetical protein